MLRLMGEDNPHSSLSRVVTSLPQKFTFDSLGASKQKHFLSRIKRICFRLPFFNRIFKPKLFLHFDYSVAGNGYEREPHRDGSNRLAAGLVYLNEIVGGKGGEFTIYRHIGTDAKPMRKRQPNLQDVELVSSITPKRGLAMCFLSDENSYHGVNLMEGYSDGTLRAFCYFGVSTDWELISPNRTDVGT